ncbi:MAG TPA: c-type cytochrome [Xanthobacteraceae bacterium]
MQFHQPEGLKETGTSFRRSATRHCLCSSCHGPGGYKLGAPPPQGQYSAYIERQLAAFAQGIRQNAIFEQMRAITRRLIPDEMKSVAEYYGTPDRQLAKKIKPL